MGILPILLFVINLFLIYFVIRNAIDNSRTTELLEQINYTLKDIRDELKEKR